MRRKTKISATYPNIDKFEESLAVSDANKGFIPTSITNFWGIRNGKLVVIERQFSKSENVKN
jgi:hypothetical protein